MSLLKRKNYDAYREGYQAGIEANADEMRRLKAEFERYASGWLKKKRRKDKFVIKIVYGEKEDNQYCDAIRKSLNHYGNDCSLQQLKRYKENSTGIVDYTIFYRNIEQMDLSKFKKIFNEAGCSIWKSRGTIVIDYRRDTGLNDQEFIAYYKKVVGMELDTSYDEKTVGKMLGDYEKAQNRPNDKTQNWLDRQFNRLVKLTDDADRKSYVFGKLVAIQCLPAIIAMGMMSLPIGISEVVFNETIRNLSRRKFDSDIVKRAQQQILLIKLCEYIREKQMGK